MTKYVKTGTRVMDTAFMRDQYGNVYTDEALVLACLFHAKGKRNKQNEAELAKLLDDPNQPRSK